MEKVIKIEEKEITLSNATEWIFIYNDQFGHDIVETITPMISSAVQIIGGLLDEVGDNADLDSRTFARLYNTEAMDRALIYISTMRMTDIISIAWSMAKAADDSVPLPRQWVKQFESFPLDVIAPAIVELLIRGFSSSKNWERLQSLIKAVQPKQTKKKAQK